MKKAYKRIISAAMVLSMCLSLIGVVQNEQSSVIAVAEEVTSDVLISVDINGSENRAQLKSPEFQDWTLTGNATPATATFEGVEFKLSTSTGNNFSKSENKALVTSSATPYLTCDGAWINADGTVITLEITGLTTGRHTITTWHNYYTMSVSKPGKLAISVDGVQKATVTPTSQVKNDLDAGIAYIDFDAVEGQPVVITIEQASDSTGTDTPVLNAFEINGAHPILSVSNVVPEDNEGHHDPENGLSWDSGEGAIAHDVYFGTDAYAVKTATTDSEEYKGRQTATTYEFDEDLSHMSDYYWRVDEIDESGNVIKGKTYHFQVRHLAFPTAEGYGRFAKGGRGGQIVEVTNLNDSGEGSLRWALEEVSGPRIVVFKVGGVIELGSKIIIKPGHDNVYVAGQTAPGDGITLINYSLGMMGAEDVIIRNIRVRVGDSNGASCDGMGMSSSDHCIIDHCSISWSTDEGFSSREAHNITFQYNIIAEALHDSVHYDANNRDETENHSFAGSISGNIGSIHHNLIVNCAGRNWSMAGGFSADSKTYGGYVDVRNNTFYNFRDRTTDGGVRRINFVNNYYKQGPESPDMRIFTIDSGVLGSGDVQRAYLSGNMLVKSDLTPILDAKDDAWVRGYASSGNIGLSRSDEPFFPSYVTPESAEASYENVIANAGAIVPARDYLDSRYVYETVNSTYTYTGSKQGLKGIIDSQEDVGGYPTDDDFKGGEAPADADHDGMPDTWETDHGLNPEDYNDASIISLSAEGYTNIEMYLNELMGDPLIWADGTVTGPTETSEPEATEKPIVTAAPYVEPEITEEPVVTETPDSEVTNPVHIAVDMNGNESRANLRSPTFTDWSITSETRASEKTFDNVTVEISSESGTASIVGSQNKNLANEENTHYLSCDGIVVEDNIKMTITGLPTGTHTIATWHNFFKSDYGNAPGVIDIEINGATVDTLAPTLKLDNDSNVGISYNYFVAEEGKPVVIYIKKSSTSLCAYTVLNGFEIDGHIPVNTITNINPGVNEEYHDPSEGLSWDGADNAVSHDVYFGTDSDAVTNATHASDEYKGNQTETTYELPDNLTQQYTYYWRIDEIDADGNVVKGSTNMFKVRHIAFPSATGDGAYAKMARGARTVVVNTLEDTGAEGSLRWALEVEKGARIVVFEVTGVFKLNKVLTIPKEGSNVYVAGQTAPGEIIIENLPIIVEGANDVVFRNVKFTDTLPEIENLYGLIFNSSSNCIVDNCVFTSLDDGLITKGTSAMSIQNNKSDDGSDVSKVTGTVVDTDQDGMPDVWEYAHGLDYKDKMDARDYNLSAEGYTNFEMYLNELMGEALVWNEYTEIPVPTEKPAATPKPTKTPDVTETPGPSETVTPVPTGTETADPGSSEEPYLLGDVNKDGSVNAIDALMVLKHAAKLELLNDEQRLIANLDGNESIDAKDALKILRIAAKLDLD